MFQEMKFRKWNANYLMLTIHLDSSIVWLSNLVKNIVKWCKINHIVLKMHNAKSFDWFETFLVLLILLFNYKIVKLSTEKTYCIIVFQDLTYRLLHGHKKRKDSLETWAAFSWILILTWSFGGGLSNSASTFFKIASASWFWCS